MDTLAEAKSLQLLLCTLSYDRKRYAIPRFAGTLEALNKVSERFDREYKDMKAVHRLINKALGVRP